MTFYDNLCYDLNTDSEHLYILREPPLAAFTQLKPIVFQGDNLVHSKQMCSQYKYAIFKIFLARE